MRSTDGMGAEGSCGQAAEDLGLRQFAFKLLKRNIVDISGDNDL